MITKGIVSKVIDKYTATVRMPLFDRDALSSLNTSEEDLAVACISSLPNVDMNLQEGDIVFVAFEDNDYSNAVIIGCLYCSRMSDTYSNIIAESLQVMNVAKLPSSTYIGDITPDNISCLSGCTENIADKIAYLQDSIDKLIAQQ